MLITLDKIGFGDIRERDRFFEMKDLYRTLGVFKNASQEEIREAYRNLARIHHPDRDGGNEEMFQTINDAYAVLGDAHKRKVYDEEKQRLPVEDLPSEVHSVVEDYFSQFPKNL